MTPSKPLGPVPGLGYADLVSIHSLIRLDDGSAIGGTAPVAEEVPVAMVYNGEPFVVMMASPADLEELAVGFSVTEGIVGAASEVRILDVVKHSRGVEVQMQIGDDAAAQIAERRRGISARTGCGVCGIESIDEVLRVQKPVTARGQFAVEALWRAAAELDARQPVNAETRSVHAAALAGADGALEIVREDVGRHNAVDKVVGAMLKKQVLRSAQDDTFLVVTSRASYELVQKTAAAGIPLLAAVSRPTSLAIQLAQQANITLVGLLRGRSANVYSHPERLGLTPSPR
jgi:formate dehydrogenase accessory protein FdhD